MNTGSPILDLFLMAVAIIFGPFILLIGGTGMGSDYIPSQEIQKARRERKAARRAFIRRALGASAKGGSL